MTTKEKTTKKVTTLEATIYSSDAKKAGTIALPEEVFGLNWNADLVHQVVTGMQANARQPIANVKDRAQVSGGGKKPWNQKGTGRARHGSTRSPIWRHGGITHGPSKDRDFSQKINKKMRTKALYTILAKKFADGQMLFVSEVAMTEPKTKVARALLTTLGTISGFDSVATRRNKGVYLVLPKANAAVKKSFQNMGNVLVGTAGTVNPVDILAYKNVLVVSPDETVKAILARSK